MVTDIGRGDLLLGLTAASECPAGPHISGILCTGCGSAQSDISPHIQHILNVRPGLFLSYCTLPQEPRLSLYNAVFPLGPMQYQGSPQVPSCYMKRNNNPPVPSQAYRG